MSEERHKIIPKKNLITGRWYVGRGRNGNVGIWIKDYFLTIGFKYGDFVLKQETHYDDNQTGCFQPYKLVDEGIVEPFGTVGWSSHYGKALIFNEKTRKKRKLPFQAMRKHDLDVQDLKAIAARMKVQEKSA